MTRFLKLASVAVIVLAANFFSSNLYSQDTGFYRNMKEKVDFVFEGEIVKSIGKWNTRRTMIYTEHEIRLTKVFKGDLCEKEIKLVTIGGETETDFVIAGAALQLQEGYKGIFFAQEKPLGMLGETEFKGKTCFADDPNGFVIKRFNDRGSIPLGFGALYQKEKYDIILGELGQVLIEYPEVEEESLFSEMGCNDSAYQTSAEITFQNIGVTGNFENVELDIMIKGLPQGVKFGKCEFSLTFPTNVFGQYLVQNSLLNVTKGDVVQGTDYSLTVVDEAANKVKITVLLSTGSLVSPYALTGSVEKLLHCSFSVANPSGLPHLKASDFTLTGNVWYECDRSLVPFRNIIIKTEGDVITPNFENLVGINYHIQKFYYRDLGAVKTLKFDIYASSASGTLFNSAKLYIDYGDAFNTNLVAASGVSVARGPALFSGSNSNYGVSFFDDPSSSKTLRLEISPLIGQSPTLTLTPTPVHILSVTLRVNDCTDNGGIEWNDLTNNNGNTYLDGTDVFQYMPITYDGSLTSPICGCNLPDPVITGFSEAQVRAGTGERLTVLGNNFGHTIVDGSCFVQVRDGDGSSSLKTQIPVVDIIDWTNTAITFIVPSATVGKINGPMASGGVKVFNECDDSNEEDMDVEYAVMNYRPSISERAFRLALEKQSNNGIVFKFSDNVGTDEKMLTTSAIETWCSTTSIHWSHGETLQNYDEVDPADGINHVVEVPSSELPSGADAATVIAGEREPNGPTYEATCNDDNTYYVRNIDIIINQSTNFDVFDASDQRIFLHEFGHAHMLNHAAKLFGAPGSQKLMYYTYDFSGAITSADLNGANTVFAASAALLGGGGDCPDPIDTHACTNSTHESGMADRITVSPVPFSDGLTIKSEQRLGIEATVMLFGAMGNKVLERQFDVYGTTIQLEGLGSLPDGVYFLHVFDNGQYWSQKLIKTGGHE